MAGSVIDGEDVVQEALVKAIEALPEICSPEWWRRVGPAAGYLRSLRPLDSGFV
jgi:DNA-directed RNA polymerase specialized sigma24 family protein